MKVISLLALVASVVLVITPAAVSGEDVRIMDSYVIVNAGTNANVYPYWSGAASCRFQMLYLRSEIGRSGHISWFVLQNADPNRVAFTNLTIKMCETPMMELTVKLDSNYGYRTPVTAFGPALRTIGTGVVNGWDSIPVAFDYSNNDNLLVEIIWNGPATGSVASFYGPRLPRRRAYVWNWQGNIASGVDTALYNARFTFRDESDDVGVIRLISPIGAIDSGATVTPACFVYNYGTTSPTYNVRMKIGSLYSNTALVTTHAPGTTRYVTFPTWSALPRGGLPVSCSTELMGDVESRNDRQASSVSVEVHDIGVRAIVAPTGSIPPGSVSPQARVRNYGTVREACSVSFTIPAASYAQTINLPGGLPFSDTLLADFPSWAALPGIYTAKCSTYLASDQVKGNDVLTSAFTVAAPETGWVRKSDFPLGHKSKKVRDGCCLAFLSDSSSSIYALKGSGTCEFYEYHIQSDAWVAKESVPVLGSTGKKRRVKKGATIALAEGKLYATKGSATLEFWQYNPSYPSYSSYPSYPWTEVAPVPLGAKAVREGTGAVAVTLGDTTYVYFLKGSGTFEFWRYNTIANAWEPRANAPAGVSRKPFKNGSCIAFDGANTIYAVKGFYDEFFAYDCRADAWTTQAGVPFIGRAGKKRRIKAGAGMAYRDGQVYLLKGNNTREFWNYAVDSTYHWSQLADMPLGDDKNVKGGGAIVYAPSHDALYATKGSGTFEFYKYGFTADRLPLTACRSENTQSSIFNLQSSIFNLRVSPNPFTSATFISYSLAKPGSISLKLYDATGKLVSTLASGYHTAGTSSFIVHRSSLSPGIYLLRLETENAAASGKLIVE